jgi:hypothetical protein
VNPDGEYEPCSSKKESALVHWSVNKNHSGNELYTFKLEGEVELPINDVLADFHVTSDH